MGTVRDNILPYKQNSNIFEIKKEIEKDENKKIGEKIQT